MLDIKEMDLALSAFIGLFIAKGKLFQESNYDNLAIGRKLLGVENIGGVWLLPLISW